MNSKLLRHPSGAVADPVPAPMQMRMDCPDCATSIELSLPSLLAARPVWCSGCGARFDINLDSSADVLRRVVEGVEQLRRVRDGAAARG